MKTLVIKTQRELDSLPTEFTEFTVIKILAAERIYVTKKYYRASVEAMGNSSVVAWENSSVEARENSSVQARENSSVEARENSYVEAMGKSSVVASGNSSVIAWGNSSVEARGNSYVEASGNSSVIAMDNSSVEASGNSSVEASGNSSVEAWGNSSVVAMGKSSVVGNDFAMIAVLSKYVIVKNLFDYSVANFRGIKPKVQKKHKTATIIKTSASIKHTRKSFFDRLESDQEGTVILYKSVNPETRCDYHTGQIKYEGTVSCPDFDTDPERVCGGGLHLSPTAGAALSYHQGLLLKCRVKLKDIIVNPNDITKVRCKKVEVIGEVRK